MLYFIYYVILWLLKEWNNIKLFNFRNVKRRNKVLLSLNRVQIDLIIKSLYVTQCNIKKEDFDINLLFENKEIDFDKIFYLQRFIGASANRQIYNIIDNDYFIKDR